MRVTFTSPFILPGLDEMQPAGIYLIETEEMPLESVTYLAYRRLSTVIHLHPMSGRPDLPQILTIEPKELDAAIVRDRETARLWACMDDGQRTLKKSTDLARGETGNQAIERGENEGMIVLPR